MTLRFRESIFLFDVPFLSHEHFPLSIAFDAVVVVKQTLNKLAVNILDFFPLELMFAFFVVAFIPCEKRMIQKQMIQTIKNRLMLKQKNRRKVLFLFKKVNIEKTTVLQTKCLKND